MTDGSRARSSARFRMLSTVPARCDGSGGAGVGLTEIVITPGGGGAGERGVLAGRATAGAGGRISLQNELHQRLSKLADLTTDIQYSIRSVFRSVDNSARRFPAQEVAMSRRVCPSESEQV